MSKKTILSRITEVILSLGIPAVGYLSFNSPEIGSFSLLWQIPVTLMAAWHVILINDSSFSKQTSLSEVFMADKNISGALLIPLILIPSLYLTPLFGTLIFLTILNWDIYSLKGKRNWMSGLLHNFIGGALHFLIGLAAAAKFADIDKLFSHWAEVLFFAFTMTAGAMHHDSFDVEEDKEADYVTGAVKFSSDTWWRLAVVPFIAGMFMLLFAENTFAVSFLFPSAIYLLLYIFVACRKTPSTVTAFRPICRLIFIAGALIYLYRIF